MRIESSVTSVSWIPSEAVEGATKLPFSMGVAHYDAPLPDHLDDLEALRDADRFRFANVLSAWVEVDDGRIIDSGYSGGGMIGSTTMRLGPARATLAATSLPDIQREVLLGDGWATFVQTCGGRTGVPAPRRVAYPPFVQVAAPLAWTTLSLTIRADGTSTHELVGASPFPRHWVYDSNRALSHKSGLVDFKEWYLRAFGKHTPWGDEDSPALVTAVETSLERELSVHIMRGGRKPRIDEVRKGGTLVEQGDEGHEVFLLLDGVLTVEVDGTPLTTVGPGAVLGERAVLEGGRRTATLRAQTGCRVARMSGDELDPLVLAELAAGHRREEVATPGG